MFLTILAILLPLRKIMAAILSKRGQEKIAHQGYKYTFDKTNKPCRFRTAGKDGGVFFLHLRSFHAYFGVQVVSLSKPTFVVGLQVAMGFIPLSNIKVAWDALLVHLQQQEQFEPSWHGLSRTILVYWIEMATGEIPCFLGQCGHVMSELSLAKIVPTITVKHHTGNPSTMVEIVSDSSTVVVSWKLFQAAAICRSCCSSNNLKVHYWHLWSPEMVRQTLWAKGQWWTSTSKATQVSVGW